MKPNIECRRLAELLREKAMTMSDPELKAEYAYLVRGFLDLATQLEQDMAERKVPLSLLRDQNANVRFWPEGDDPSDP
jgi:hypothetical protein